jgi:ABC-type glycerol-3-phosphate transport system substrate-binding protein
MKNIQVAISVIFAVFIFLGVFVFAGIIPSPKSASEKKITGSVTLWGTINKDVLNELIQKNILSQNTDISIKYSQHSPETFANDLIEALASGEGPDIAILPEDLIARFSSKVEPFSTITYPERTFRDTFIEEGELFVSPGAGVLGLPFIVDPMVMYWNRNIFSSNNIIRPPEYWDEFLTLAPVLSKRSDSNDVLKSAVAMGEFRNITHAKDLLSLLVLQTGNPIFSLTSEGAIVPTFGGVSTQNIPSASEALRFFSDFSDPQKTVYSWNRSLPESKNAFLSQDLAMYFGYASELRDLQTKNPNLNFDTAQMPQVRDLPFKSTFGKMSGVSVMKTSANKPLAFLVAQLLTTPDFNAAISEVFYLPPTQRALLSKIPTDPFLKVFYDSALISTSYLDINPQKTYYIFQNAIESISSGKLRVSGAVEKAQAELSLIK